MYVYINWRCLAAATGQSKKTDREGFRHIFQDLNKTPSISWVATGLETNLIDSILLLAGTCHTNSQSSTQQTQSYTDLILVILAPFSHFGKFQYWV